MRLYEKYRASSRGKGDKMSTTFKKARLHGSSYFINSSLKTWVVRYPKIEGHHGLFYVAYRIKAKLPKGRMPWTVDNERIGRASNLRAALALAAK